MPDCVSLLRYRTCPGIVSSVHSGTGLTDAGQSGIPAFLYTVYIMDMDMQCGHGHATRIWSCTMDLLMQHGLVNAAWIWTVDMHGCRNADKKTQSSIVSFPLVYNS
jgi:hypothetical protein